MTVEEKNYIYAEICNLCVLIFNDKKWQYEHYSDYRIFMDNTIKFVDNIRNIIDRFEELINDNLPIDGDELYNNLSKIINKYFIYINNINYFQTYFGNQDYLNYFNLIVEILNIQNYSLDNFKTNCSSCSDMRLSWTYLKIKLKEFDELQKKKYQELRYLKQKRLENPILNTLMYHFFNLTLTPFKQNERVLKFIESWKPEDTMMISINPLQITY